MLLGFLGGLGCPSVLGRICPEPEMGSVQNLTLISIIFPPYFASRASRFHTQPENCDVLVVTDPDRLGRSLSTPAPLLSILQYHNISMHSVAVGPVAYLFGVARSEPCGGQQS